MPDINQPTSVAVVHERLEGRTQENGKSREKPPKQVADTYEEVAKAQPADDSITILGIPIERITAATHAALAGLVAENNYLRNALNRHERAARRAAKAGANGAVENETSPLLAKEVFPHALAAALAQNPEPGKSWVVIIVHLKTYEDVRRNSGLLAANGALEDVGHRFAQVVFGDVSGKKYDPDNNNILREPASGTVAPSAQLPPTPLSVVGYAGGSNFAGLATLPTENLDTSIVARTVRDHICESGFKVGGLDMALEIQVAASVSGAGESPHLALGRVDHILRNGSAASFTQ